MASDLVKIEKLDGENYQSWKFNMKLLLMERGLYGFATGTEKPPVVKDDNADDKKKLSEYNLRSDKAYSIIALGVKKELQVHIQSKTTAKEAWDTLQNHFEFVSVTQIVRLSRRFYAGKMEEGKDLMKHITEMTSLAEQLRGMKEDISDKKFAMVILGSLPESYDNFLTSMNARDADDLNWNSVKGLLGEEFMKRQDKNKQRIADEALLTRRSGFPERGGRGGRGRGGGHHGRHHPYNSGNKHVHDAFHAANVARAPFKGTCFNCQQFGHRAIDCPNQGRPSSSNTTTTRRDYGNVAVERQQQHQNWHGGDGRHEQQQESYYSPFHDGDMILFTQQQGHPPNGAHHDEWFIDSGATKHMTNDKNILSNYHQYEQPSQIYLGDDSDILAYGEGQLRMPTSHHDGSDQQGFLALRKVLFVPKLSKNLLSVSAMTQMGAEVTFDKEKCMVSKDEKTITIGHCINGKLYKLTTTPSEFAYFSAVSTQQTVQLWHERYGHLNMNDIRKIANSEEIVYGMKINNSDVKKKDDGCEPCALGKMHRLSFPKQSQYRADKILEMIHTDVCGPMHVEAMGGSRYMLTFTDDYSRYTIVYFLKKKSEVLCKLKEYVNHVENMSGQLVRKLNIIKRLRSDNGGEYISKEFVNYCTEKGIARQFTNPYCPEQNGVSERLNRTIMEGARSMLYHSKLPLKFWAEAANVAVYLRNRSPTSSLNGKTPYEFWFNKKPDVSHLRVFGCICYVHVPDERRKKLDPKSFRAIFIGYPDGTKGYKIYDLAGGRFTRSRNVMFHEEKFHDFDDNQPKFDDLVLVFQDEQDVQENVQENAVNTTVPDNLPVGDVPENIAENNNNLEMNRDLIDPLPQVEATYEETFMRQVQNVGAVRQRKTPNRLISDDANLTTSDQCYLASLTSELEEPKSFKKAMNNEHSVQWKNAMDEEFGSLQTNNTWELVPRSSITNRNIVGCRWVYKIKRGADGSIDRFKARLVAQGYSQTEGVDYEEVFSPVARATTIRMLLSFANTHDLEVHQMDVKTAFLNGVLDNEIFMEQPEGFIDPNKPDFVCKLNKGLYGLKQSARCWNQTLDEYLVGVAGYYKKSAADGCIYLKNVGSSFIILAIYVDDIIPISNDISLLNKEKDALCKKFEMVDNGEVHFFLGMMIKRDRNQKVMSISQKNYIHTVLEKFGMADCKPVATPIDPGVRLNKTSSDDELFDLHTYQQAIGCLTYISTTTRPDISAAVGMLSQFMSNPNTIHWTGIKRILRYLKGTCYHGLVYDGKNGDTLTGYSDADWGGDIVTRRSTSGYIFQLGSSTISWCSRKQATVAKSSTEAEYVALSIATQEAIWLRRLLVDLGFVVDCSTTIFEDNQGAIELSKNPKHHNRTKHIDVNYHFVRERVATKEVNICYCPTNDMLADMLTKGVTRNVHSKFCDLLGVKNI